MNTRPLILFSLLGVLTCEAQISGSLTPPPGPPVSVMRTLEHIESRIPLVDGAPGVTVAPSGTITIAAPGSYFLAADLAVTGGSGLVINSSRVTVDLRGFAISSSAGTAAGDGIDINGSNIAIYNGHIVGGTTYDGGAAGDQFTGPGFANGINATSLLNHLNIRLRDLTVSGMDLHGIYAASRSTCTVESCIVNTCGGIGIHAGLVRDSIASNCGGYGIFADTATSCRAISVGADGINAGLVSNCQGTTTSSDPSSDGIQSSYLVESSFGQVLGSQGGDGIKGFNVRDSVGYSLFSQHEESDGIEASGRVSGCYGKATFGARGILGRIVHDSEGVSISSGPSAGGIEAVQVRDCIGSAVERDGIEAVQVRGSIGSSVERDGIDAVQVSDCIGSTVEEIGIHAIQVTGSHGTGNFWGISTKGNATGLVRGSMGFSEGTGIRANTVIESRGVGDAGYGVAGGLIVACDGRAEEAAGIFAELVAHSRGVGARGIQLGGDVSLVVGSSGIGTSQEGIRSFSLDSLAANCFGQSILVEDGEGISNFGVIDGSAAWASAFALRGDVIRGSRGNSDDQTGVSGKIVESSFGMTSGPVAEAISVEALLGMGNVGEGGPENITHKYLAP